MPITRAEGVLGDSSIRARVIGQAGLLRDESGTGHDRRWRRQKGEFSFTGERTGATRRPGASLESIGAFRQEGAMHATGRVVSTCSRAGKLPAYSASPFANAYLSR